MPLAIKEKPRTAEKELCLVETRHSQRIKNLSQQAASRTFQQNLPKAGLYPSHFSPYLMKPDGISSSIIGLSKEEVEEDLVTLKLMFQTYFVSEYYDEDGVDEEHASLPAGSGSVDPSHSSLPLSRHDPATSSYAHPPANSTVRQVPSKHQGVSMPVVKDKAKGAQGIKRPRLSCVAPRNRKEEKAQFDAAIRASMMNSLTSADP
eukprot:746293-Hanusia_phi.AAC.5